MKVFVSGIFVNNKTWLHIIWNAKTIEKVERPSKTAADLLLNLVYFIQYRTNRKSLFYELNVEQEKPHMY